MGAVRDRLQYLVPKSVLEAQIEGIRATREKQPQRRHAGDANSLRDSYNDMMARRQDAINVGFRGVFGSGKKQEARIKEIRDELAASEPLHIKTE